MAAIEGQYALLLLLGGIALGDVMRKKISTFKSVISKVQFASGFVRLAHGVDKFVKFLSALATVGAFGLAFWAYNYSNIPEELVAKFDSEIAALNEEVTDIRREKRALEDQRVYEKAVYRAEVETHERSIGELNFAKASLEQEIKDYEAEKVVLQGELQRLIVENRQNKKYRQEYLADSVASIFGATFTNSVQGEIKGLKLQAKQLRDFAQWLAVVAESERYKTEELEYVGSAGTRKSREMKIDAIGRRGDLDSFLIKSIPASWHLTYAYGMGEFRGQNSLREMHEKNPDIAAPIVTFAIRWRSDGDAFLSYPEPKMTEEFRRGLAVKPDVMTGRELLEVHIAAQDSLIDKMPQSDRTAVKIALRAFLSKNANVLNANVSVYLPPDATSDAVVMHGEEMLKNIDAFERLVISMPSELSRQILQKQ